MTLMSVRDLHVSYGPTLALRGVSLDVDAGEVVSLLGANGAGKTSLAMTLSGLVRPKSGSVVFDGIDLTRASPKRIVRSGLIHVPEGRGVLRDLTVRENLILGLNAGGRRANDGQTDLAQALQDFPVLAQRSAQRAGTLSGGEQQMLVLARAILAEPRLLILDEPSLGLAPKIVEQVFELVRGYVRSGVAVLLVEQNASLALELSDRAYVLTQGVVSMQGKASDLASNPEIHATYFGSEPTAVASHGPLPMTGELT